MSGNQTPATQAAQAYQAALRMLKEYIRWAAQADNKLLTADGVFRFIGSTSL